MSLPKQRRKRKKYHSFSEAKVSRKDDPYHASKSRKNRMKREPRYPSYYRLCYIIGSGASLLMIVSLIYSAMYKSGDTARSKIMMKPVRLGQATKKGDEIEPTKLKTIPIYWINLDKSKDRFKLMTDMFSSLGLTNTHRVVAHDINSTWRSWFYGTLVFHPLIKLIPHTAESIHWTDHSHLRYYYEEAACTLSHLEAIKQAYDDGNEHALILEDDAQLSTDFFQNLSSFLKSAPPGWKVLQFSTNNVS